MSDSPVFVITGASSGIGAATARQAVEAGYRVVLAARSKDKLDALVEELGDALAVETDVTRWEDNERLISTAVDAFGRVDVVFANAGFGAKRGWLEETPEHWRDMVLTNVLGAAYTVRAAIPALKETRGHVLLTGSVAGRRALPGSLYSSTKWAVTGDVGVDPRRPQRHRHPDDADLPGRDGDAVLRQPVRRAARAGRHRARRALRRVAAAARGRQRDPRPPDGAGSLDAVDIRSLNVERVDSVN